mmetsp:Transcript_18491/g.36850  ORF Transcript_18491/g.36850 Transcript_18491/m.36850 type:complete len:246 (-) Transcript_18491:1007-1744(-)
MLDHIRHISETEGPDPRCGEEGGQQHLTDAWPLLWFRPQQVVNEVPEFLVLHRLRVHLEPLRSQQLGSDGWAFPFEVPPPHAEFVQQHPQAPHIVGGPQDEIRPVPRHEHFRKLRRTGLRRIVHGVPSPPYGALQVDPPHAPEPEPVVGHRPGVVRGNEILRLEVRPHHAGGMHRLQTRARGGGGVAHGPSAQSASPAVGQELLQVGDAHLHHDDVFAHKVPAGVGHKVDVGDKLSPKDSPVILL